MATEGPVNPLNAFDLALTKHRNLREAEKQKLQNEKLAQEKELKEKNLREKEALKRKEERVKLQQARLQKVAALAKKAIDPHEKGTLDDVAHLAKIAQEGPAMALLIDLSVFFVQFLFNISYIAQISEYNTSWMEEILALRDPNVFAPDVYGNYPIFYELDDNGKVDKLKPRVIGKGYDVLFTPNLPNDLEQGKIYITKNKNNELIFALATQNGENSGRLNLKWEGDLTQKVVNHLKFKILEQLVTREGGPLINWPSNKELRANGKYCKPVRRIYEPDENGFYPKVYMIDANGQINYKKKYKNGDAPFHAIRANGLTPRPSWIQGELNALTSLTIDLYGANSLSTQQKLEFYGYVAGENSPQNKKEKDSRLSDQRIQQSQIAPPRPAMRTKPTG